MLARFKGLITMVESNQDKCFTDISEHRRPTCEAFSCPSLCSCEDGWVDCRDRNMQILPQSFPRDATEMYVNKQTKALLAFIFV